MRWLVDEGLPKVLVDWLVSRGEDVLDVAATPLQGSDDCDLWRIAGEEGRLVVTRDLGFMLPEVRPSPLGVVLVRTPDMCRADAILRLVQAGLSGLQEASLCGHVTVITPGRVRQRRLRSLEGGRAKRRTPR